jgi:hypothetical protein
MVKKRVIINIPRKRMCALYEFPKKYNKKPIKTE